MLALFVGLLFGAGVLCIYWSWWPREPRQPRGRPRLRERMADELIQAGFESISVGQLVGLSVMCFLVVLLASYSTSRALPVALAFAVIAGNGPRALVGMRARRRRTQLRELWPDAVDNIASAVRAGLALPEALSQLAIRGPEELRPAFAGFAEDYRSTGRFQDCLDRLKGRLADPVADRLIESLRIAREVGGSDLGRVLRTLSGFLRDDARTRAELETRQGWTVNAARVAAAAPWVVLAMLSAQPEALHAYSSPAGVLVLLIGAGVTAVAYRLMLRIARLPEDQRVLR
jgi:tight adherence protein B